MYMARTKKEKKIVALKVLYKKVLERESVTHQLKREVEIHSRIKHANVIRLYSYFHDETRVYLVLEYAPGGSLYSALEAAPGKKFEEPYAASIIKQLCSALALCHSFQVVHRDIKPENILLGKNNQIKLADFGWSVANTSKSTKMRRQTLCGTVDYLPPEMVEEATYDESVDAWMVGVLLYEMIVGKVRKLKLFIIIINKPKNKAPFSSEQQSETYDKVSACVYDVPESVSPECKDLLNHLLVKNPESRMKVNQVLSHPWILQHSATI